MLEEEFPAPAGHPEEGMGRGALGAGDMQAQSAGLVSGGLEESARGWGHCLLRPRVIAGCPCVLLADWGPSTPPFLAGALRNSSEPQSRSSENRTEPAPACTPAGHPCPRANVCLPLGAPCHLQACANTSTAGLGLPGVASALWKEFLFSVPAGPPAQYSVSGPGLAPFCLPLSCLRAGLPVKQNVDSSTHNPEPPAPTLPPSSSMRTPNPRAFVLCLFACFLAALMVGGHFWPGIGRTPQR